MDRVSNGVIYATTPYLNHMADNWDALVLNNYEAVMPLPWRKKHGFYYLYQPPFTAQLGLFGNVVDASLLEKFLAAIPKKFGYWNFPLNHHNLFSIPGYPIFERKNFVLNLNQCYQDLYNQYRNNIKRNIKRAVNYKCRIETNIALEQIAALAKQQAQQSGTPNEAYEKFAILFQCMFEKGQAKTYGVYDGRQQLLAACVFFFYRNRAYYILTGNHPNGRTLGASHLLIDAFIKDYANTNLLLDFEGSDINSLAFFYSSFGALEEKYAALHLNRLPWYARWLKK